MKTDAGEIVNIKADNLVEIDGVPIKCMSYKLEVGSRGILVIDANVSNRDVLEVKTLTTNGRIVDE